MMKGNNNLGKALATIVMWMISGVLSMAVIMQANGQFGDGTAIMMAIPLIIVLLGTFFMWVAPEFAKNDRIEAERKHEHEREKNKRYSNEGSRMAVLMEMMDEDERQAFKQALKRKMLGESRLTMDGELSEGMDYLLQGDEEDQYQQYKR